MVSMCAGLPVAGFADHWISAVHARVGLHFLKVQVLVGRCGRLAASGRLLLQLSRVVQRRSSLRAWMHAVN